MITEFLNKYFKKNNKLQNNEAYALPINIIKNFNKTRPLKARKHLCNAPFKNMFFSAEGDVYACCFNQKYSLGNINEKSLKEIWNSEKAIYFRNQIENKELINGCDECKYSLYNKQYKSTLISTYDKYPGHSEYPTYMEFQISNLCNLECSMCIGDFSSTIAIKREHRKPTESPYGKDFLSQLEEFIPHLKYTLFSGGEPFISPIYYDIWELIRKINPSCNIMVQTNGTILNEKVKNVLNGGIFNIGISIDSLNKETYKNIRVNASLDETLKNILFFKEYCHTNKNYISLSFCPMQQNWHEIPDIINFCNKNEINIFFSTVWFPGKNALWVLDSKKIIEIIKKLSDTKFIIHNHLHKENIRIYKNLINTFENWYKIALKWENYKPIEIDPIEIMKTENEIFQKINNYYAGINNKTSENNIETNIISKLKNAFNNIPNNDTKLKGLQLICSYKESKIIENIYREDEEGLLLLIKNLHRFRDL